jgi:hypothetical protein
MTAVSKSVSKKASPKRIEGSDLARLEGLEPPAFRSVDSRVGAVM